MTEPSGSRTPRKRWNPWLRRLILFTVVPYLILVAVFTALQRSLIYFPARVAALPAAEAGLGDRVELLTITTADGLTLSGWLAHPPPLEPAPFETGPDSLPAAAARPADGWLLIYFPGNAGHRGNRVYQIDAFTRLGFDLVLVDYRGYAENPGSPSEADLHADARSTWGQIREQTGVAAGKILLHGESLGGGVAVRLAAELSREGTPPGGLLLKSTYSSLVDVGRTQYPWLPVSMVLRDRFESIEHIGDVTCPIVMVHGEDDRLVPIHLAKKLFEAAADNAASGTPKQFLSIAGAGHNNVPPDALLRGARLLVGGVQ